MERSTTIMIRLRPAEAGEAEALSALAMRSKAYWGYPEAFMDACRHELSYTPEEIVASTGGVVVAETEGTLLGFYALERVKGAQFELEALFVEPDHIGSGVGRALIEHAKGAVAGAGGGTLLIQGDPHAEPFYRAAGGVLVGHRESASIPGRLLPLFTICPGSE